MTLSSPFSCYSWTLPWPWPCQLFFGVRLDGKRVGFTLGEGRILSYPVAKLPHGDDGEGQAARLTGKLLNKELWGVRT
jgi:hypothetical protein